MLSQETLDLLGADPQCKYLDNGINIKITDSPKININNTILLNPNKIRRTTCLNTNFTIFPIMSSYLYLANDPLNPSADLSYPQGKKSLCEDLTVQVIKSTNDGKRGLNSFNWIITTDS